MRNYEERNQSGKTKSGKKQKRHWRIIALLLCICVAVTAYPELPSVLAVFAAEKTDEGGQETQRKQETAQDGQEPAETTQHSDGKTEDTAADEKKDATEETAENRLETAAQDGTQEEHVSQESTTAQTVLQEDVSTEPNLEPAFEEQTETNASTVLEESADTQESALAEESVFPEESSLTEESTVIQESTSVDESAVSEEETVAARPRRAAARAAIVESGTDWTLDADGLLTITSDKGFESLKSEHPYGWYGNTSAVTSIFIAETVTTIPSVAFSTFYPDVTSVTISEGVQRIENMVFYKTALESVTIPQSVTEMQSTVFGECANLKSVDIQAPLTEIRNELFQNCTSLTSVTFPDSVTRIQDRAFEGCTSLQAISLPPNLEWIGWYAFKGTALERITIPEGVTTLLARAFENTASLEEVHFLGRIPPENNNNSDMFRNCKFVNEGKRGIIIPCGSYSSDYRNSFIVRDWGEYVQEAPHNMPLVHTAAKSATCTEDGNIEYWTCSVCGNMYSDADAASRVYSVKVNALGHNYAYTAAGAQITETCQNNCGHSETATLSIKSGADLTYTGTPLTPLTATYSDGWAGSGDTKPAESAIVYTNNTNVGTAAASLTISDAIAELTFEIKPAKMMGITAKGYTGTYDAAAHGITVSGVPQGAAIKYGTVNGSYTKNTSPTYTNVGTYTVYWQVTKANYETVTGSQKIVISARTLTDTDVTTGAALTYNGAQQTQTISVTAGGRTLAQGKDYTVSGNTGTAAQTYTLTVMGKGNYAGTVKKQFTIAQKVLTAGMVSGVSASYIYMGSAIEPAVTVKDGNKTLAVGTDYTIAYQNNTSAGTASVTVTGKGNYKGTVTKTFQITPKTLTADMVSGVSESYIYTGSAIEPAITAKDGIKILVSGTDYTVTYKDNTSAGTASVTVAGTGNYGGTVVKNFTIRYNPLPDGKTLEDYVTVSPEPKNGWYGADIILDAVMGITIGETPAAAGGQIAFTQETGTQNVTKTIYIKDKDGSIYETQFSYKLDKTPPVIDLSNKTVTNGKGVWNWIVGKTGMTIEIPKADITDDLSGVAQVGYAAADDSGVQQTGTVAVKGERYVITLAQEFSGTIKITATDYAGNTSEISLVADGGKVVAEDTAPTITTDVSEGYYETPTELTVTVSDDTENVITAGIASVTYQVDNGAEQSVAVDGTALQENITFKIPASEIPTGVSKITVCATDNAGNTATAEITVKVKGPEHTPDAEIDYRNELLTGLVAGADYVINGTRNMTADENGSISIQEEWLGTTLRIVKKGNNVETLDSATQSLPIPSRPTAPDAPEKSSCTESAITVKENAGAEYRADGGAWQAQTQFAGLTEKTVYTFTARYAATDTSLVSVESVGTQMATMPEPSAADKFAIDYVAETFLLKDGVEAFADAECTVSAAEGSVNAYMGATVYIRYPENGIIPRSNTTAVEIPQRPDAPTLGTTNASYPTAQDGALTGLDASYAYEIRKEGGAWKDAVLTETQIRGLGAGTYEVRVKATQASCFYGETARADIGEEPAKPEKEPQAVIEYRKEILSGLVPDGEYTINGEPVKADENGEIAIKEKWFGKTHEIVKKSEGAATTDSSAQSLPIPLRPGAPDAPEKSSCTESTITVKPNAGMEYRADGGGWQSQTQFAGLTEKTVYTFTARYAATNADCNHARAADSGQACD